MWDEDKTIEEIDTEFDAVDAGMGYPPFEPVTPEMGRGSVLGYGNNGLQFAFEKETECTMGIGTQGTGKTTFLARYILDCAEELKIIAMDSLKQDYRHLKNYRPNVRVFSYRLGTFKDNFLQPPTGLLDREWDSIFADIFSQSLQMIAGAGSFHYLYINIRKLKKLVHPRIPNLKDLYEYIKDKKEAAYSDNFRYRERILSRLESLIEDLGDSIDCSEGYKCEELQDADTIDVIEWPLKADSASFSSDVFLFKNLLYRMKQPPYRRRKTIVFIIDEAKRNFGKHKANVRYTGNMDNLSLLISSVREYSMGFKIFDQDLESLHPNVPAFCQNFILFRTNAETTYKMSRLMGLTNEQTVWLSAGGLETGQCIIKSGTFPPVLVNIPHFNYQKNVTDEEILF